MKRFWTLAPWLTRLILLPPTIIFSLVAARYLAHPVASAAAQGIVLPPGLGVTIARVGFGGFPLGCVMFLVTCLTSRRRLLTGLTFVAIMVAVLLVVRVFGMTVDATVAENIKLVNAEIGLMLITATGIFVERKRRTQEEEGTLVTSSGESD